ncbi:MAG: histidine triad nucleotide-binding protein [Terriglobales bacterium]|jgi:histidine triad (HIT) family protein
MLDCLFCRIARGELPSNKVYEDARVYAFEDANPQAPTHILIVPKTHIAGLQAAKPEHAEEIGYCNLVAAKIAYERHIDQFRIVCNTGPRAGQSVFHLHLHLLGGRDMRWPPG